MGRDRGPDIPDEFDRLDDRFFSLGQDDSYYTQLNALGDQVRDALLAALNDVAVNPDLFARALREPVTGKSLLRNVSRATVRNQFHRLALGGARLSAYEFGYTYPTPNGGGGMVYPPSLDFKVVPESQPPTNVHVIIGRNGVGKSRLLDRIESALVRPDSVVDSSGHGTVEFMTEDGPSAMAAAQQFASLVSVAFSAFDEFEPVRSSQDRSRGLGYTYIGLKKKSGASADEAGGMKDPKALAVEFGNSVLVLLDEPESHLHPPLLSAFIRALSDLLVNRNGVAIITTHSPVVLQEVPSRCVWRLRRAGDSVTAERPDIETFGENVGTLTSEVFGLEVTNSGFHRMIAEAAAGRVSYAEVLELFGGQLGSEARALLQALVAVGGRGY